MINDLEKHSLLKKTSENSARLKQLKKQLIAIEDKKDPSTNKSINDYKDLWDLYLKGTEKLAYPSFLKK